MRFLLEAFDYAGRVSTLPKFKDYDLETVTAMLEETGKFCTNEMLPLNRVGDQAGVHWDPETKAVTTPEGFKALWKSYAANGFAGIHHNPEFGGGGSPHSLGLLMSEMGTSTNKSFSMCPGLTHGLVQALDAYGSDQQKADYLPKLIEGEWTGTMCLTEPQCGTDLGLIRTKAEPEGDHYRLTGNKIWITFGEHDLTDNIVHLVLARLPDAPEGIKGISAFIVPKVLLDGTQNTIHCSGLEHKMGIHASPTCEMTMENAVGYLVGEPHKGMRSMFVMMNTARLHVGQEGVSLGEIAYQTALEFAKDRRQMRALDPSKQDHSAPADNIMVHPDVRRMLLNIKSTQEAMRALTLWIAMEIDVSHGHADEAARQEADDLVALLTPIVKSYCTERGFENVNEAMQVCGGAGYTTDWSIEQYLRDVRIALIYEGTNAIQALDLVGRKLPIGGGRLVQVFASRVTSMIRDSKEDPRMAEFIEPLKYASKQLTEVTMNLATKGMQDREEAGAAASNYLNLFALTALAYCWVVQCKKAVDEDTKFAQTKLKTARYFFANVLPEMDALVKIIGAGKQHMMALDVDEF
jgi:alkylation response protein AidB-like acyl-CoA dehydrogenase